MRTDERKTAFSAAFHAPCPTTAVPAAEHECGASMLDRPMRTPGLGLAVESHTHVYRAGRLAGD
jgi:hypothetical protein